MNPETTILLLLALLISVVLGLWAYLWNRTFSNTRLLLASFRALALFLPALLLLNPTINRVETEVLKPQLLLAMDNSQSISILDGAEPTKQWKDLILNDIELSERFALQSFRFGAQLENSDLLDFTAAQTNLGRVISDLNELSRGEPSALVLLTDGNQNTGAGLRFGNWDEDLQVFPVAVGDTTQYEDIRIRQTVLNKYAFKGNQFPLEVSWRYTGNIQGTAQLEILLNGKRVANRRLSFSRSSASGREEFYLEAESAGLVRVEAKIIPLANEKNRLNNTEIKRIEVLDESVKVGIISAIEHPDIGALKQALESSGQRKVEQLKPTASIEVLSDFDVLILYQPNGSFQQVMEYLENSKTPNWLIAGSETQWGLINAREKGFEFRSLGQREEAQAIVQEGFQLFDWNDFDPSTYPPLEMTLGEFSFNQNPQILFKQKVRGIELNQPLLFFTDENKERKAVWVGEGLWRWRMHAYRTEQSFDNFDQAMSLILRYLSASQKKNRLLVESEATYRKGEPAVITARYFDPTFVFDPNASLELLLENRGTSETALFPFALRANRYEIDLSTLEAGQYSYTVREKTSKRQQTGQFEILEFNYEQLALFTQSENLNELALNTRGQLFFPDQWESFKRTLLDDDRFVLRQRSREIVVPLIQVKWLLFLWVFALACEWFIRKYRGWI